MLNVRDLLDARASQGRRAIVEGVGDNGVTWRQVGVLADRWLASGLVGPVGLAITDPVAMAANFVAALASGVIVVPLDPTAPRADLDARIRQLGVRSLVIDCDTAANGSVANHGGANGPSSAIRDTSIETWQADTEKLVLLGGERRAAMDLPLAPAWPSLLMASSGTTGEPKIVPLSEAQLLSTATGVAKELRLTSSDIGYSPLPLFHINGLVVGVLSALIADSTIVVERQFSRRSFWSAVGRVEATWLNLVPAILAILSASPESTSTGTGHGSSMATNANSGVRPRLARSASAPLPAGVRERFEELTSIPVVETYGMTEAASQITANPIAAVRPGSVGVPVDVALRVVGEDENAVPTSTAGRVQIKGERVTSLYWASRPSSSDATCSDSISMEWTSRTALGPDGWLDTGDIGYLDEDGYVYLVGRDGDVINRGGEKIAPREIEEILLAHPDVTAAVVVGRPHPTVGAEPVAFVIASEAALLSPDVLAEQLSQRCELSLSRFKRPVEIHVTSSLPSGPTGKIRRGEVANLVAAGVDPSMGRAARDATSDRGLRRDLSRPGAGTASRELHPSMGST